MPWFKDRISEGREGRTFRNVMRIEELPKAWGRVMHVFDQNLCAVSVLRVEKGGFSSRHFHQHRVNRFIVVEGSIDVSVFGTDLAGEQRVRLAGGDVYDVRAGVPHKFEVIESGIVVEVYWPDAPFSFDDIVRFDQGGRTP